MSRSLLSRIEALEARQHQPATYSVACDIVERVGNRAVVTETATRSPDGPRVVLDLPEAEWIDIGLWGPENATWNEEC